MPVKRHFLDWDTPLTESVVRFLVPSDAEKPVDLADRLIVVPTRQAGRRLREALAQRCAADSTAVLSARVVQPSFLLHPEDADPNRATGASVAATWARVLLAADPAAFTNALPSSGPSRDFDWALHTGEMLQQLRATLSDGGYSIANVVERHGTELEEAERWQEMAELEQRYLADLAEHGTTDPTAAEIAHAEQPVLPEGVTCVVLASVPDASPLAVRALDRLAEAAKVTIDILIHAPGHLDRAFDRWGRPCPEAWCERQIDVPDSDRNIRLAGTGAGQARLVVEEIARDADRFGPIDIAVGAPDASIVPFLETELADHGLPAFDPADQRVEAHALFRLLRLASDFVSDGSYAAVAQLIRHPDLLAFIRDEQGTPPGRLLRQLDRFQNTFLPPDFQSMLSHLSRQSPADESDQDTFGPLRQALTFLGEQARQLRTGPIDEAARSFLKTVYAHRSLGATKPDDQAFTAAASCVTDVLKEFAGSFQQDFDLTGQQSLRLFLRRLKSGTYHAERRDALVDIEGWLELPWNNAPLLLVTGMTEGCVPDSRLSDVFLPDSLRARLELRDDRSRLARDSYLMTSLVESRRAHGRACFFTSKTTEAGDPTKPSRLLFRCADAELPDRARHLFGPAHAHRALEPSTLGFQLSPTPPPDLRPEQMAIRKLSVTAFRTYLACPFRFYLSHVLNMEPEDDLKRGLDALDFGTMVHAALQEMGQTEMWRCEKEAELADFLAEAVETWVTRRFGPARPLPIVVALDSARQRLRAAAREQVRLLREGWDIERVETSLEQVIGGIAVRGKLDRLDCHRDSGKLRILDYKTSDTAINPSKSHVATSAPDTPSWALLTLEGKPKRWVDLQLPLYSLLLPPETRRGRETELAYFNLPKATTETGVSTWKDLTHDVLSSAGACAEGVIQQIRDGVFWPPAEAVAYDTFEALFPGVPSDCVDPTVLTSRPEPEGRP